MHNHITLIVIVALTGYLYKCGQNKHSCKDCKPERYQNDLTTFIDLKLYNENCKLCFPPIKFVKFIERITSIFNATYPIIQSEERLLARIKEQMDCVPYSSCSNFPLDHILHQFIKMKIFYDLKEKNNDLKTREGREKLMKLNYNYKFEKDK